MLQTCSSLTPPCLDLLLEEVLADIRGAIEPFIERRVVAAAYLIGSAVQKAPRVITFEGTPVVVSDLDLLLFVRDHTSGYEMKKIQEAIEASRNAGWYAYHGIHIGYRIRPVSAVGPTLVEYASWGVSHREGYRLLAGHCLLEGYSGNPQLSIKREHLALNALSKLWFILYSLPHDNPAREVRGVEALWLQRRFASAAARMVTLRELAREKEGRTGKPDSALWNHSEVGSDLEELIERCDEPASLVAPCGRAQTMKTLYLAAKDILAALRGEPIQALELDLTGLSVCDNAHRWAANLTKLGRLVTQERFDTCHLRSAVSLILPGSALHWECLPEERFWPTAAETLHEAQMRVLSANLISYSLSYLALPPQICAL